MNNDVNKNAAKLFRQNSTTQITKPKLSSRRNSQSNVFGVRRKSVDTSFGQQPGVSHNGSQNEQSIEEISEAATSEFKLLKKIAELTQVVHMLFQSSHTNEVELGLVKDKFREEIDRMQSVHDQNIRELSDEINQKNSKIEELTQQLTKFGSSSEANMRLVQFDLDRSRLETEELQSKCQELTANLDKSREINMNLAKELEESREILASNEYIVNDLQTKNDRLTKQTQVLISQKGDLETKLSSFEAYSTKEKTDLTGRCEEAEKRAKEMAKVIRELREQIAKLEMNNDANDEQRSQQNGLKRQNSTLESMDENLEIARLKRELRQAKLELQNRESNFNRVFSDSQPVHVTTTTATSSTTSGADLFKNGWLPNISPNRVKSEVLSGGRKAIELNSPMHSRIRTMAKPTSKHSASSNLKFSQSVSESAEFRALTRKMSSYT